MEHDRAVALAILADIRGVEPLGQDIIKLQRAALPGAADRVSQVEFELGRIEGALARQFLPAIVRGRAPGEAHRLAEVALRLVPHLVRAESLLGPQRELDRIIGEAEIAIDAVEQVAEDPRLLDDLVLAAEDMGIVLGELADAKDAV